MGIEYLNVLVRSSLEKEQEQRAIACYIGEAVRIIPQGGRIETKLSDIILAETDEEMDDRSGEEIAEDFIKRHGLKVGDTANEFI